MGRILRIGNDSVINYSFLATTAYNEAAPAATTLPWSNSAAMDQKFDTPNPIEVTAEGVLVTFERFPDTFDGAMVKIKPVYNVSLGEDPSFELWTHDSVTLVWTKRRRIDLANLFVGVESNQRRVVDFTFFPFLPTVDKVWITMDPGPAGTPQMNFISIQLFGQCETSIDDGGDGGGGGDPCDMLNPDGTVNKLFTGFDDDGNPCPGTGLPAPSPFPTVDLCNPASVEQYEDVLRTIPGAFEAFDAWYTLNLGGIREACAGNTPDFPPGQPVPPGTPPFPPLDLCDDTSIDAYRAAIAGDAALLAEFNAFIDSLTEVGFFELSCPAAEPPEVYVDPHTLMPAADPDTDNNTPFGTGPGGSPPPSGSGNPPSSGGGGGGGAVVERTARFILVWSGNDLTAAETAVTGLIAPLPASTTVERRVTESDNYGPATGVSTIGVQFTPATFGFLVGLHNLPFVAHIGLRMWVMRLRGSNNLRFSVSDSGIFTNPAAGFCPAGPDWIITPSTGFAPASPLVIGDNYLEYFFTGNGLANTATIELAVPRINPLQNDGAVCTAGYQPRSIFGFQRGGCLVGPIVKQRARWVPDISLADYDASGPFDYIHVRPYAFAFDITVRAALVGNERFDVTGTSISLLTEKDTQPVETCP